MKKGASKYGFGWNETKNAHGTSEWHMGNTCGFRAYIHRGLTDKTTVIVLTNGAPTDRIGITESIIDILSGSVRRLPQSAQPAKDPSVL